MKSGSSYYAALNLSSVNTPSEEKAIVDLKLLDIMFKDYGPAGLEGIKEKLMDIIEQSPTIELIKSNVETELYLMDVASAYNANKQILEEEKSRPAVEV